MLMEKITKFEYTRLLSARALQLSLGAPCLIKIEAGKRMTAFELAKREFEEKVFPLAVLRTLPDGSKQKILVS